MRGPSVPVLPSILIVLFFAGPWPAFAAGALTGRLVDADARPVAGAQVLLVSGSAVVSSTRTGADGRFAIQPPAEGPYVLRASADGLRAEPTPVVVTASALDLGTLTLQLSAVTESVVVSAAQVEVPLATSASAVTILTGEELRARQHESVADALRGVPGLTVAANGGRGALTSVFPRGGESDYTLVFVDGIQANSFGGGFDFAHLPVADIDRLEIVRGPQSALHGANAIGAVVRIVTRRDGPPSADGSIEAGSFGTVRAAASTSGSAGAWGWSASGERLTSDGLSGVRSARGETVTNDEYTRNSGAAGLAWRSPAGASLRGDLRYADDVRGAPGPFGSDPGGTFSGINEHAFGASERLLAALGASMPIGSGFRAHASGTHTRTDGTFTDLFGGVRSVSETWSRRTTARVQVDRALSAAVEVSTGAELLRERAGSTYIVSNDTAVPVARSMQGVFAEGRLNGGARTFVTAGLRVERIARDELAADPGGFAARPALAGDVVVSVNPKVSAGWYVRSGGDEFTRVRAAAGTGIRPPDAFEIAFTDNPSLRPERSRSAEVGLDHTAAAGRLLFESTLFFNSFDDLIVAVGSFREASRYRTDNISNARARGLELAGTARFRTGGADVQVRTAYTLLDTEILALDGARSAPPPFAVGDRLLRRPAHQVAVEAVAAAGRFTGFVRGGGRSAVRDVDPSFGSFGGVHLAGGYASWDAGASWRPGGPVQVLARVTNIFDRQYEETLGYPALGRGIFVGLRVAARP